MSPQDNIILLSAKIHPTAEELKELNEQVKLVRNWDVLAGNLMERGVAPLFYEKLSKLPDRLLIPYECREKLRQSGYRTLSRGMVLYEVFRNVATAFTSNGIQVVALKGIHLSEKLYEDIGLRQFSDIDLLVSREDGEKCLQILRGMGFVQTAGKVSKRISEISGMVHYPAMVRNGVSVEIHIRLHPEKAPYRLDTVQIMERAESCILNRVSVHVPERYDLLIFLCIHLHKHFEAGEIQLTCFLDIVNILDRECGQPDWQILRERCDSYNCREVVFKYIVLVNKYFRVFIPEEVIGEYRFLLSARDEKRFKRYLNGAKWSSYGTSAHIRNVTGLNSIGAKLRYIGMVLFPGKEFMIHKYRIRHASMYRLYYPYRHWIGWKGLWKMVIK
ncbi:MAG: nucleotidyltransferase domain-containing protein [Paludibacteraceae bacterium]